jgi:hypothetical protein
MLNQVQPFQKLYLPPSTDEVSLRRVVKTAGIRGQEGFRARSPNSRDEEKILKKLLGRAAKSEKW